MVDFPDRGKVADALLTLIGLCGGMTSAAETYRPLAKFFALSDAHLSCTTKSGGSYWHNKIQSAREQLATQGLIERPRKPNPTASQRENKGVQSLWILTPDGKRSADKELLHFGAAAQNQLRELAATLMKERISPDDLF